LGSNGLIMVRTGRIQSTGGGGIRLIGIPRTKQRMRKKAKESKEKLRRGMWKAGRFLLARTQELVPVDTGALKKSGKLLVNEKHVGENVPAIVVTYGNDKVDYAIYQHENLDYFHNIGQAKFIEQPAREYRLTLIHIVEREFK